MKVGGHVCAILVASQCQLVILVLLSGFLFICVSGDVDERRDSIPLDAVSYAQASL
jgi:hypothetical protein